MATALIADIIDPEILGSQVNALFPTMMVINGTDAVMKDVDLGQHEGGTRVKIPRWKRIDDFEEMSESAAFNRSKITSASEYGYVVRRGKSYVVKDTASLVSKADPAAAIKLQLSEKAARQADKSLVSVLKGAIPAGNTLNVAVATGTAVPITDTQIIDASLKLGDNFDKLTLIVMHSLMFGKLLKDHIATYDESDVVIGDEVRRMRIPLVLGKRVLISDDCPVDTTTANYFKYTTFILGPEALYFAPQRDFQVEFDRDIEAKEDIIVPDMHYIPHLVGVSYTGDPANDVGPTEAELATAGNWTLAVEDTKVVRAVKLVTN